jgi:hypothetical protein
MMRIGIVVAIFLKLLACEKNSEPLIYQTEPAIEVYIDRFVQEAALRGITIKKENLIAEFTSELATGVCGQCLTAKKKIEQNQRKIIISNGLFCWSGAPNENREALVFHELGHCLLGRSHKDDLLPNNAPASIMFVNNVGPYQPCQYSLGGNNNGSDCNFTSRRQYYMDELFNEKTPIPTWAK